MPKDKLHSRLASLFSELDRLAAVPDASSPDVRRELDELRARLLELESQVKTGPVSTLQETPPPLASLPEKPPAASLLYEKEQIGYAFSGEQIQLLRPETLQAVKTENALQSPLMETGRPVGTMLVEPAPQRSFTTEDERLAEAVARQASLQIQNLRLLAAAERARTEAQEATRRFTHQSWDAYLDAIHQSERIGYLYDQAAVQPFNQAVPDESAFQAAVNVMEEQVGRLFVQAEPGQVLTEEDKSLAASVARQVAQQVENLRLLAEASRARAAAEETTRLLARENWNTYLADHEEVPLAFVYDSNRVQALAEGAAIPEVVYSQPLSVQGQKIGQLGLAGLENISEPEAALLAEIAARVSAHLETLRLNDELRQRAAELQELDRLKSSFLANMSHELRTPLNSILGFSDVMLEGIDGQLTDYMDNDLRLIQKNGKHLLNLINDVLDMAKIESGRMNLHLEKFRVQEVFEEVTSITSTLASEKNLALFVDPQSDREVEILADTTRIRQVMINLVNNSIKFTEKGKISLKVERFGQDKVMITVKDTGIGIPSTHLETIFQEFAQVDTSTTRKVGGTGLGLPISRRLVEMHGGRLWVESSGISGEGSTFFVELPLEAQLTETIEKTAK